MTLRQPVVSQMMTKTIGQQSMLSKQMMNMTKQQMIFGHMQRYTFIVRSLSEKTVFLNHLNESSSEESLRAALEQYGEITNVSFLRIENRPVKAFVEF